MVYNITEYSYKKARENNLTIKPSTNSKKKIDVFKGENKVASIGAIGYKDYPTYVRENGKSYADSRKKLYKIRHKNDLHSGNGKYANLILW